MKLLKNNLLINFKNYLYTEEKAKATKEKYIRDVSAFIDWLSGRELCRELVIKYKTYITEKYSPASVNSIISSLNSFFNYLGMQNLRVKALKIQRQIFVSADKELTKAEYLRLLNAAKNNKRLYYLMQTICSSGIRVSELKYITVEAIKEGNATIKCKGKMRIIMLPDELCRVLLKYTKVNNISSGSIFITKSGKPLDRSDIWKMMKSLCAQANVDRKKVFPHNLRHLFARTYYKAQKDIVRLADILGHSSINTTRIYTMETGEIHRRQIQSLGLLWH